MNDGHDFSVSALWRPATRDGHLENRDRSFGADFSGAPSLGGKSGLVNPEELLLSALAACFVQTWAIFLAKLKLPPADPSLDVTGVLEADPGGGFRMARIAIVLKVPAKLLSERREDLERAAALAEKYCIVSKAVRGEGRTLSVALGPTAE